MYSMYVCMYVITMVSLKLVKTKIMSFLLGFTLCKAEESV